MKNIALAMALGLHAGFADDPGFEPPEAFTDAGPPRSRGTSSLPSNAAALKRASRKRKNIQMRRSNRK